MDTEIRFSVGSDVVSVPEISAVFGMEPDHGWSVGEVNSRTGRVFKNTYWALSESIHSNLASPRAGALMRRLRDIELRYIDTIDRDWSGRIHLIQRFEGSDIEHRPFAREWTQRRSSSTGARSVKGLTFLHDRPVGSSACRDDDHWVDGYEHPHPPLHRLHR
jgi:hypothetical protein